MKKVFIIHENTKPIKIGSSYIQIATDFVCTVGYIQDEKDKDPNCDESHEAVYMHDAQPKSKFGNVELDNFLKGIWFETYEEGCKVLTKILHTRTMNDNTILGTYNKLVEKYPEAII